MTAPEVRQAILDIIARIAPDEDLSGLNDEERIRDQIDLDSMDFLDIVMELRKVYGIEVPESDYMELSTLSRAVAYLEPRMAGKALAARA
jgi:acyl carrier protein